MRLAQLELRRGDRSILESWTRSVTVEARVAKRARIVLLAAVNSVCWATAVGEGALVLADQPLRERAAPAGDAD